MKKTTRRKPRQKSSPPKSAASGKPNRLRTAASAFEMVLAGEYDIASFMEEISTLRRNEKMGRAEEILHQLTIVCSNSQLPWNGNGRIEDGLILLLSTTRTVSHNAHLSGRQRLHASYYIVAELLRGMPRAPDFDKRLHHSPMVEYGVQRLLASGDVDSKEAKGRVAYRLTAQGRKRAKSMRDQLTSEATQGGLFGLAAFEATIKEMVKLDASILVDIASAIQGRLESQRYRHKQTQEVDSGLATKLSPGTIRGLVELMPPSSFHPDRVAIFNGSRVPTNYFIPVDAYREDIGLIRSLGLSTHLWRSADFDGILVQRAGIAELVAQVIRTERDDVAVIGPQTPEGDSPPRSRPRLRRGASYLVVTDTILSGQSSIDTIRKVRNSGADVVGILAFADRGHGGPARILAETGVSVEAMLDKQEFLGIVRRRFVR